ncbi:MAG: response regulator [Bacteroidota bacterium]
MKKIILIDDDATTNYLNKIIIEKSGLVDQILVFDSATEALGFFEQSAGEVNGSLVLLDINMPIMNGWEFLDRYSHLNEKGEEKIVLLTSSISPSDKKAAEENPYVADFKSKPLSSVVIKELVQEYFKWAPAN